MRQPLTFGNPFAAQSPRPEGVCGGTASVRAGPFAKGACTDNVARARELLAIAKLQRPPVGAAIRPFP
jgi:hypothetical protein